MPLKRPYGTARTLIMDGSTNFIVQLYGSDGAGAVDGEGESPPRHELTGDGAPDNHSAWAFLHSALVALEGTELDLTTRTTAVDGVRAVMGDLDRLAHREAEEVHGPKPFRGTLLGVEVALLDLAARAMGLRISQLLTERRSRARISIATISTTATLSEIGDRAARQKRFPITRLKGDGSLEHNLALLQAAATGNAAAGRPKPLWIDINEAMDLDAASEFVRAAAAQMAAGELPAELIVEGPLPQEDGVQHADLQRVADQAVADLEAEQDLRLQIMADENIWDAGDLSELQARGGCRAINIKAPKAGGLLPSLDLAEAAVAADPQMRLCIGGMLGTSEITAWALHNLGKSMPRIDYMTTVPPRNVAAAIAAPPSRYSAPGSNLIALQHEPGLGTALLPDVLAPFVQDEHDLDDPGAPPTAGPAAARPGLELAELPDILDGRWLTAPQPGARALGGTFLVNEIAAGQVVFTMETGGWADSLRRRARQARLSTEEVAERAASAGAAALVTSTPPPRPDLPVLTVDDPRRALWALGAHARRRYTNPVVAVTGTAGKSTTTAMLQHVLAGTDRVHVPTGNWNTIDGVSFTLTGLLAPSDIAVLEMAHVGFVGFDDWSTPEMARPDVAVVTSIGQAHADLDATVEGTARLKARIFRGLHGQGTAVLNLDTPRSDILLTEATAHASQVITYGRHPHATLRLVDYVPVTGQIRVQHGDQEVALRLGVRGEHNALNALAVLAVLHALGRSEQDYLERFAEIRPLKGRGQVKKIRLGDRRLTVVDQSYNANPASMRATLNDFGERFRRSRRVLVLGDMLELGADSQRLHTDLLDVVLGVHPDRVYLVGEHYSGLWEALPAQLHGARVPTAEDLDAHLHRELRDGDVLFVKSSHGVGLHRLVNRLQRGELHVPKGSGIETPAVGRASGGHLAVEPATPTAGADDLPIRPWQRVRQRWATRRQRQ